MAIMKYSTIDIPDPVNFVTWLNTNKEGTFLENATITSEKINNNTPKYKMTITFGTDIIEFFTWGESSSQDSSVASNWYVAKFNDTVILNMKTPNGGSNSQYCRSQYRSSILSTNGLLVGYNSRAGSGYSSMSSYKISYQTPLLLTLDNNGNLTAITPQVDPICGELSGTTDHGSYVSVEINGYTFTNNNVPTGTKVILKPSANIYATALQRFTGYDASGNGYYTPFAYYATATQFTPDDQTTLGVVEMNNKRYITNGRWYVQDTD